MKMSVHIEEWPLARPFRISGFEWVHSRSIVVQVEEDGCVGRGEAQGVFYRGETADSLFEQVDAFAGDIARGVSRADLQYLLPAGGSKLGFSLERPPEDVQGQLYASIPWTSIRAIVIDPTDSQTVYAADYHSERTSP